MTSTCSEWVLADGGGQSRPLGGTLTADLQVVRLMVSRRIPEAIDHGRSSVRI